MIRTLTLATVALIFGCAGLQTTGTDRDFDAVFATPSSLKNQIFDSTQTWIAENLKSAQWVTEYEDKEKGTLIGKGVIPYPCSGLTTCLGKNGWKVPFTMRVDVKDREFKLTFSNIKISWPELSYDPTGARPAFDRRAGKLDLDVIRPKLLGFGGELSTFVQKNSKAQGRSASLIYIKAI